MPVVKNTTGPDTAITIWRFPKQTDIKGVINDGTSVSRMEAKYYLQLNNTAIGDNAGGQQARLWKFKKGDGFIIRAEISADAEGPFWGYAVQPVGVWLEKVGDDIVWYINGNAVASVPYQTGIHDYGFIGLESNGTKYSQPYYDGDVVHGSSPETFSDISNTLLGGMFIGNYTDPMCIHGSSYGIRIYDVVAETADDGDWHLYPCSVTVSSTTGATMFDALNTGGRGGMIKQRNNGETAGGTSSASVGEFPENVVGIGIQLPEDLRAITGSGYFALIPLIFEDGGIDTLAGWTNALADTNPSKVSETNQPDKYFAFYIGLSANNTNIPLPDGCTATKGGSTSYAIGELIRGRKPKWSIWNDGVTWGKYTVSENGVRYLVFNTLKNVNGTYLADVEKDLLGMFEGYNTAANRPPKFNIASSLAAEFHNTICCVCKPDNKIIGPTNGECLSIFKYDVDALFGGNINIGNLAPWNLSAAELAQSNLLIFGASVLISDNFGGTVTDLAKFVAKGSENHEFNSASTTDKTKFRDGSIFPDILTFNEDILDILYLRALMHSQQSGWQGSFPCTAQLGLIGLNDSDIKTERIVPTKSVSVDVTFDHNYKNARTSTGTYNNKDRFLLGDKGGTCVFGGQTYEIGVLGENNGINIETDFMLSFTYSGGIETYLGTGLGCAIALVRNGDITNIAGKIMAFIEIAMVNENGVFQGRYWGFTNPESLVYSYDSGIQAPYREISHASDMFGLYSQNMTVCPTGKRVFYSSDLDNTRACIWRWKDLLQSDNTVAERPADSGIAIPITSRMRVFENTTTNKGPVAWGMLLGSSVNWHSTYGLQYKTVTISGSTRQLYVNNADHVLPYEISTEQGDYVKVVDAWLSLFNGNTQIMNSTLPSTFNVILKETVLHTWHQKVGTQAATSADITPVQRFSKTLANTSVQEVTGSDSKRYKIQVTGKSICQEPIVQPNGLYGAGLDGFYNLKVWIHKDDYSAGSLYLFDPSF